MLSRLKILSFSKWNDNCYYRSDHNFNYINKKKPLFIKERLLIFKFTLEVYSTKSASLLAAFLAFSA